MTTDRGVAARPARRRRARVAARPGQRRQRPAAERAAVARPRGPSARFGCGPRAVDRQARDPRRLRLVVPGGRRAARRGRLVRPARPREGSDGGARHASSTSRPSATRATGSPTASARRRTPACSSPATPRATACPSPPRASARRCTSGSRSGGNCARWSRAAARGEEALARYAAFSDAHRWKFEAMLQVQHLVPRLSPAPSAVTRGLARRARPLGVRPLPRDRAAGLRAPAPPRAPHSPRQRSPRRRPGDRRVGRSPARTRHSASPTVRSPPHPAATEQRGDIEQEREPTMNHSTR